MIASIVALSVVAAPAVAATTTAAPAKGTKQDKKSNAADTKAPVKKNSKNERTRRTANPVRSPVRLLASLAAPGGCFALSWANEQHVTLQPRR
jgi:hypothetical protein